MSTETMYVPQAAALPYRRKGKAIEILLVTSRETGRWVLPKGGIARGRKASEAAAAEALEEAGIKGRISSKCLGVYTYAKAELGADRLCRVEVFPLKVKKILPTWHEQRERTRRWMSPEEASSHVAESDLAELIRRFAGS